MSRSLRSASCVLRARPASRLFSPLAFPFPGRSQAGPSTRCSELSLAKYRCPQVLPSTKHQSLNTLEPHSLLLYNKGPPCLLSNNTPLISVIRMAFVIHISTTFCSELLLPYSLRQLRLSLQLSLLSELSPESPLRVRSQQCGFFLADISKRLQPLPITQLQSHFHVCRCLLQQQPTSCAHFCLGQFRLTKYHKLSGL